MEEPMAMEQPADAAEQPPEAAELPQEAVEQPRIRLPRDRFHGRKYYRRRRRVHNFSWLTDKKDVDFDKRKVFDQDWYVCCGPVAALEDVEIVYNIKKRRRSPDLSLQHLVNQVPVAYPVECARSEDISKIQSFQAHTALRYIEEHGVCLKKDLKFRWCKDDKNAPEGGKRMRIEDVEEFECNEEPEAYVLSLIREYPIVGELEYFPTFLEHKDGIFMDPRKQDPAQEPKCDHAVVIIGYGTENDIGYYLIKNSHGRKWGSKGIGKVERSLFLRFARPINPYIEENEGGRRRKRRRKQQTWP